MTTSVVRSTSPKARPGIGGARVVGTAAAVLAASLALAACERRQTGTDAAGSTSQTAEQGSQAMTPTASAPAGDTPTRVEGEPGTPKGVVTGNPEMGGARDPQSASPGATMVQPGTGEAAVTAGASQASRPIDPRTNPGGIPPQ